MRSVSITRSLNDEAVKTPILRLGPVPAGLGTPDRYVWLRENDDLILRIDVYAQPNEAHGYEAAAIWSDFVVVGFGERVYFIHIATRNIIEHYLGSYFGSIYPSESPLYVTSAERVFRVGSEGQLRWASDTLGVDGVLIHDSSDTTVRGEGEWDPPGGWKPFTISALTGRRVSDA